MPGSPSLSVVIVAYESAAELTRTLPALWGELQAGDELIVVDNGSTDGSAAVVSELAPAARLLEPGENLGFAGACNAAAEVAAGDLLVILNPDAMPLPGWGEAIRLPVADGRGWGAWMALVACEGATRVNTSGNPVHFTGLAWAGGHGSPLGDDLEPREVPAASGACLALALARWRDVGGFPPEFFLYHEDIDLSMRLRLFGGRVGLEPRAVVDHEYEFGGRPLKWRWLERNRLAFLVRVYPAPLLLLLAPALLMTELALLPLAAAGGWLPQKLASWGDFARWLPRLLRERRAIQARRSVSAGEFAAWLTPDLDSSYFGRVGRSPLIRAALRAYWRVVTALLR
jgi:N-acetylglucosaminyl-diphospho-decaprenol L-rhamnosyltransferase